MASGKAQILKDAKLGLIGYGAQGRAEALNLRRSGIPFELGLRPQGPSWNRALEDGFHPKSLEKVAEDSMSLALNIPDQDQANFYRDHLRRKHPKRLIFAHGFNTHFKLIPLENEGPSHLLVAPKGAASGLIEFYAGPSALPAILAVENSKELEADKTFAEVYAAAIGCHPKGLIWATFKDETECDLFSEQVLLCGGVTSLLRRSYEVLTEAGYNSETAYFETLFELKLIVDLLWREGISGMRAKISPTARYGDITRGDRVIDASVKARMKEVLSEIQSGEFAKEFLSGISSETFRTLEKNQSGHPIEKIGAELRSRLRDHG